MKLPAINIPQKIGFEIPQIDQKYNNLLLGGFLLILFLCDYFLIMQPFQISPLIKMNSSIKSGINDFKQAKFDIANIEQYKEDLIKVRQQLKEQGSTILSQEEIPTILDNISKLARKTDVQINQIMPMKESKKMVLQNDDGRYYSMDILIMGRGGYHELGRFFGEIETDPIFMSIGDFDIASKSDDNKRHVIQITIKAFIIEKKESNKT